MCGLVVKVHVLGLGSQEARFLVLGLNASADLHRK